MARREIKRTQQYELAVANLGETFSNARKIITGAEWSLGRSPESDGVQDRESGVWRACLLGPGFPEHHIYYGFDDSEIRFLTIKPCGGQAL